MTWKKAKIIDAIRFACGRVVAPEARRPVETECDFDVVVFADGTAVACRSTTGRRMSDVTPDITDNDPIWQIYS